MLRARTQCVTKVKAQSETQVRVDSVPRTGDQSVMQDWTQCMSRIRDQSKLRVRSQPEPGLGLECIQL